MSDHLYDRSIWRAPYDPHEDPDDVNCQRWAQPKIAIKDLPRLKQDRHGLQAAARDIIEEYGPDSFKLLSDNRADTRLAHWVKCELAAYAERLRLTQKARTEDV